MNANRMNWSRKLVDALLVYWTTFKTTLCMFPYYLVYKIMSYDNSLLEITSIANGSFDNGSKNVAIEHLLKLLQKKLF